ncbi:MAG: glycosyltransferase family 2 protein [Pseudomonadota bacterium]
MTNPLAPNQVTIAAIARNEEARIADFVAAHAWASEILVYDDASTDNTAALARELGARVIKASTAKNGFDEKRNTLTPHIKTEWVLWLDIDERLFSTDFAAVASDLQNAPDAAGVRFRIANYFLGTRMRSRAWTSWRGVRLARTANASWQGPVHEKLIVEGQVIETKTKITHYGDTVYEQRARKTLAYNILEADRLTRKPHFFDLLFRPMFETFKYYVLKYGAIDGRAGLIFALHIYAAWFQRLAIAYTRRE